MKIYGVGAIPEEDIVYTVMELCADGMSGREYLTNYHPGYFRKDFLLSFADLADACGIMAA